MVQKQPEKPEGESVRQTVLTVLNDINERDAALIRAAAEDKLLHFEQAIIQKANEERQRILGQAQEQKKKELDIEENRQLNERYQDLQGQIADIRAENDRTVAHERAVLKRKLYQQREQYLTELIARARVELAIFVQSPGYYTFLEKRLSILAEEYTFEGSELHLRPEDMSIATPLTKVLDGAVAVTDSGIHIGGFILKNSQRGVAVDETLDSELEEAKAWFYENSGFKLEVDFDTAAEETSDIEKQAEGGVYL